MSKVKTNEWYDCLLCFISHRIHVYMYGIYTYIWLIFMVNVGKYTIHGSYGLFFAPDFFWWHFRDFSREPSLPWASHTIWEWYENGGPTIGGSWIFSHRTFVYTPQKSKRDTKNDHIEEKEPPFPNHYFGYTPWNWHGPSRWIVGILVCFWDNLFSRAMLVSVRVTMYDFWGVFVVNKNIPGRPKTWTPKSGFSWKNEWWACRTPGSWHTYFLLHGTLACLENKYPLWILHLDLNKLHKIIVLYLFSIYSMENLKSVYIYIYIILNRLAPVSRRPGGFVALDQGLWIAEKRNCI